MSKIKPEVSKDFRFDDVQLQFLDHMENQNLISPNWGSGHLSSMRSSIKSL